MSTKRQRESEEDLLSASDDCGLQKVAKTDDSNPIQESFIATSPPPYDKQLRSPGAFLLPFFDLFSVLRSVRLLFNQDLWKLQVIWSCRVQYRTRARLLLSPLRNHYPQTLMHMLTQLPISTTQTIPLHGRTQLRRYQRFQRFQLNQLLR